MNAITLGLVESRSRYVRCPFQMSDCLDGIQELIVAHSPALCFLSVSPLSPPNTGDGKVRVFNPLAFQLGLDRRCPSLDIAARTGDQDISEVLEPHLALVSDISSLPSTDRHHL